MARNKRCAYCGTAIRRGEICGRCTEKLRLIRQIKAMLLPVKRDEKGKKGGV